MIFCKNMHFLIRFYRRMDILAKTLYDKKFFKYGMFFSDYQTRLNFFSKTKTALDCSVEPGQLFENQIKTPAKTASTNIFLFHNSLVDHF